MLLPGMMAQNQTCDGVQQRHRQLCRQHPYNGSVQSWTRKTLEEQKKFNNQKTAHEFFICPFFTGHSKIDPKMAVKVDIFINNLCKMSVSRCKLCDN